jgi:hypothetical protein
MAMGVETGGFPVVLPSGGDTGGFGGMGGIGGLLIGALLFGGRGGLGSIGGGGMPMAEGAQLGQLSGIQAQVTGVQSQLNSSVITGEINELQSALNSANIANLQGISNNALTYQSGNAAILAGQASNNYTTLNSINGLGRDVVAGANQNALQQLNSFNLLNTTTLQGFNEIGRDTANATNQLIMGQNSLAAQMANCCCSIEKAIGADGAMTRTLINDLNVQNLQAQLADAKNANSNLSQSIALSNSLSAQTNTILHHLIPTTIV